MSAYGELLDPTEWPMFTFNQQKTENSTMGISTSTSSQPQQPSLGDQLSILGVLSSDPLNSLVEKKDNQVVSDPYCRLYEEAPLFTKSKIECSFKWLDYFIRSDGRALKSLLSQLMPKKLILLHGNSNETIYLAQWYRLAFSEVFMDERNGLSDISPSMQPSNDAVLALVEGKRMNISELTNIFHITLSEALLSSLAFHSRENVELARIKGKVVALPKENHDDSEIKYTLEPLASHENEKENDLMSPLFAEYDPIIKPSEFGSLQIISGNVSLSVLRTQIASMLPYLHCMLNEATSTLTIQRNTALVAEISKNTRGELNICGDLSPDYLHLKKLVSQTVLKL